MVAVDSAMHDSTLVDQRRKRGTSLCWPAFVALSAVLIICGACSTAAHDSQPQFPTPAYDGSNGQEVQGDTVEGLHAESLADLKKKADTIVLAEVVDERLIRPTKSDSDTQAEFWTTLRLARVDDVLWQSPEGRTAPNEIPFVGLGWNRNDDTGRVTALLPASGARVDVGDRFIAGFSFLQPPSDSRHLAGYEAAPSHWTYLVHGIVIVKDDRILAPKGEGEFLSAFDGKTVADLSVALRS